MPLSDLGFGDIGGAVSDIFAAQGDRLKAQGDRLRAQGDLLEATNYDLSSTLATQNEQFTEQSTAIKQSQQDRSIFMGLGQAKADIAGAGFAEGGSGLDILRDSASQGALSKAVLGEQGLITEAGYKEQAQSYTNMASAARLSAQTDELAAQGEDNAAKGADIGGIVKGLAGLFELGTGISGLLGGASGGDGFTDGFTPQAPRDPSSPLKINQYGPAADYAPAPSPTGGLY